MDPDRVEQSNVPLASICYEGSMHMGNLSWGVQLAWTLTGSNTGIFDRGQFHMGGSMRMGSPTWGVQLAWTLTRLNS